MLRSLILAVAMTCSLFAHAEITPIPSTIDPRFQKLKYTTDIIKIQARVGRVLEIELSPKENDIKFAIGDRNAWIIATEGNKFYLKPKAAFGDTNLKLWSTKSDRKYWFDIVMAKDGNKVVPYQLTFDYPPDPPAPPPAINPEIMAIQLAAQQKQDVENHLGSSLPVQSQSQEQGDDELEPRERVINGNYGIIGPEELTPTSVYDNGETTAITFAPNNPMPTIFAKEADGSEARVNFNVENDILIVHRVARKFMLRRGTAVACLINGSFNATGSNSKTNTVSDYVRREIIKGAK